MSIKVLILGVINIPKLTPNITPRIAIDDPKEIKMIDIYFYAEKYHQQYLASPGSRQYCSASPTKVKLGDFTGSNYKLKDHIWESFDWQVDKCVLRSDNNPIKNNF